MSAKRKPLQNLKGFLYVFEYLLSQSQLEENFRLYNHSSTTPVV
ncbi:hypothetical protein JM83_1225 [Gillisia sp. Hel_I_86]|nr:hypothetical protein JM83_1225 [Gillisia sp. Hel_I_86]